MRINVLVCRKIMDNINMTRQSNCVYTRLIKSSALTTYIIRRKYFDLFLVNKESRSLRFKQVICKDVDNDPQKEEKSIILVNKLGMSFLIYADKYNAIVVYNLEKFRTEFCIENAHWDKILCIKHFYDEVTNQDYFVSNSLDKTLKLWRLELNNFQLVNVFCNFSIEKNNSSNLFHSHCCFTAEYTEKKLNQAIKKSFLVTASNEGKIKFYPLFKESKDQKIKDIDNNDKMNSIFIWKDKISSSTTNTYLIVTGWKVIKSYIFDFNKFAFKDFKTYSGQPFSHHSSVKIIDSRKHIVSLDSEGALRVWSIYNANLISKISNCFLHHSGFAIWKEKEILIGTLSKTLISIVDYTKSSTNSDIIYKNDSPIYYINQFFHSEYGACILCQDSNGIIKLFV